MCSVIYEPSVYKRIRHLYKLLIVVFKLILSMHLVEILYENNFSRSEFRPKKASSGVHNTSLVCVWIVEK